MKQNTKVIGKPIPKLDGAARVTGRAVYGHDIELPGMLHGAILRTEHPYAEFKIDVSGAYEVEGVVCVITADDVEANNIGYKRDHPILKKGTVNCIRDEIAAVAAETPAAAAEALRRIKVHYQPRVGTFDPFEALEDDARQINEFIGGKYAHANIAETFHYEHGDLAKARAESSAIVTRRYTLPRVTHACMATSNITAHYNKTDGKLLLYSSTQVPFLYQRDMAHALRMNPSDIRIIQPIIGGGFGSKLDMYPFEPICALLSIKTGRPVQILYSRAEEFLASPTRQPMIIDITAGVNAEGHFTFRDVRIVKDNGAYTSWGATTPFVIMQAFSSLYKLQACNFDAVAVYTNNVFAGSFRGYGNPQATFALERTIDVLADTIGMDRAQIRLLNANEQGEVTGQGLHFDTCGHKECLQTVIAAAPRENLNGSERYVHGTGYASMLHVGGGAKIYKSDGCGTTIKLDPYGRCTIITGSNEIGQGSETVLAMIAGEELGVSMDRIRVINSDTDIKPWDVGVHASRTSFVAGNSLLGAIAILKKQLNEKAADLTGVCGPFEYSDNQVTDVAANVSISLEKVIRHMHFSAPHELAEASYFYEPTSDFQDKGYKGNVSGTYAFAAQAITVEVDKWTGNVRVLDVHVAQDVGRVLNPLLLSGQVHGGVLQGIGYALTEEMQFSEGRLLNPNFHNYRLLTAADVPEIHFHAVETHDALGPYGAKGVGEAPLIPTSAAIANAVAAALNVEVTELPLTPELVLNLIEQSRNKTTTYTEEGQV